MKKIMKIFATGLLIAFASLAPLHTYAQLTGSVNVEGEYDPLIIDTERINSFPQGFKYELPAANLDYEYTGVVTDFRPGLLTMGVTPRLADWPWKKRKGFVDFRAGSYLNTRLHAGCAILSDSVNTLLADLKFRSSSLYRIHGVPDSYSRPARKRYYDGKLALSYSRLTGSEGLLNADIFYRLGYFNYYGSTVPRAALFQGQGLHIPTQTLNQAHGAVSYASSPSILRGWHAGAGVDFLGYRRLYGPLPAATASPGDSETWVNAAAGYVFSINETNAVSADVKGDFLFYPDRSPLALGIADRPGRNYGIISITPQYRYANDCLTLRAGADLALSYGAMGKEAGKAFGAFHAAPEVSVEYKSQAGVGLFVSAKGGVTPSSLLLHEKYDRYQMPWLLSTLPVYSPLDARLGVNFGSFAGFTGEVALRYAIANNTPLGGWYQAYLGAFLNGAPDAAAFIANPYLQTASLKGLSIDVDFRYAYGTMVEASFKGSYSPQKGERGIFNGFDRPRWVLDAKAGVRPIKKLLIEVGYAYRGVRNCYYWQESVEGRSLRAWRLPDITDLNAKISYDILPCLTVYCKGENLINCRPDILPGLQSEGIAITGGFHLTF